MSYLVLARKYRPQTFADVVGQLPVVKTLQNSLLKSRVAHAILFSGVRGVGKTTLARIMAKAINCQSENEIKPCDNCRSCDEIVKGRSLDLHEIDGASNRGIQEIRELKERIRFLPTSSKYKIIIIDEVHMLTTEAFNALLKTLEEPPEHVYFMFATTELHKIPITILSRCQRYELKRVPAAELNKHFAKIAASENVTIDPAALALIVREAEGSVRDGLSLLDQMFSFGDTTITHEDVIQVLGLTDRNVLLTITRALLQGNRAAALSTLDAAFIYGIDIKRFSNDLVQCFRTLLLIKIGDCLELIDLPDEEIQIYQALAADFSFETLHFKSALLIKAIEEMRYTTQPRLMLETSFLKIIETAHVIPVSTLLGKIDALLQSASPDISTAENRETTTKKKISAEAPESMMPTPESACPPEQASHISSPEDQVSIQPVTVAKVAPPDEQTDVADEPGFEDEPALPQSEFEVHPHTHDVRKDWIEFTDYVKERKIWMAQDLQRADTAKEVDNELHLHYSDPTYCSLLRKKENHRILTEFVLDFFQKDLTVRFILPDVETNTESDSTQESPHKQRQQLMHDPLVQMAVEIFNGQVGDIRIGPRSR